MMLKSRLGLLLLLSLPLVSTAQAADAPPSGALWDAIISLIRIDQTMQMSVRTC